VERAHALLGPIGLNNSVIKKT